MQPNNKNKMYLRCFGSVSCAADQPLAVCRSWPVSCLGCGQDGLPGAGHLPAGALLHTGAGSDVRGSVLISWCLSVQQPAVPWSRTQQ